MASDLHLCDQCKTCWTYTSIGSRWLCKTCRAGLAPPSAMTISDEFGRGFGQVFFRGDPKLFWGHITEILSSACIEYRTLEIGPLPENMATECECGIPISPPTIDGLCGDCRCPK